MRIWDVEQDRRDFAAFYAAARDDCLRIVLVNVGDRDLAEDLVAEGFTRAWMSWRKVCQHPAPRAWVVRTALNLHVSWWRRRRREVALDGHDLAVASHGGGQDSGMDSSLTAVLRGLPLRQREVLTLRLLLDLDTETTARALGISAGTVGAHLHRALEALRARLDAPWTPEHLAGPATGPVAPGSEPAGEPPARPRLTRSAHHIRGRARAYIPDLTGAAR